MAKSNITPSHYAKPLPPSSSPAAKGVKKHGQAAWDALKKEFQQFRDKNVFKPIDAFTLTEDQKAEALQAISVIKEKRNGTLKGRTVADGRPQQGKIPIQETTLLQDNESAIKLETNGKLSSGQRTRHIDIRHFFTTDHVKRNNITIVHCPTSLMLADFFTKPLQGALFRKFRAFLLGHDHISTLLPFLRQFFDTSLPSPTAEERVGNENTTPSTSEARATSGNQHTPGPEISMARRANEILSSPGSSAPTRLDAEQHRASSHSLAKYPEI